MAYRFELCETFEEGLRRISLEQIQRAQYALSGAKGKAKAVHIVRKATKRLRALLRLIRPAIAEDDFQANNVRFRDIARALSGQRDKHVMLQNLAELEFRHGSETKAGIDLLRSRLGNELMTAHSASEVPDNKDILAELAIGGDSMAGLSINRTGFDIVGEGFARTYKKGRKRRSSAFVAGHDEAIHDWRKLVQLHWRHLSLLREVEPQMCAVRIIEIKRLSDLLGRFNDLCVLQNYIAEGPPESSTNLALHELGCVLDEEKNDVLTLAKPLSLALYTDSAKILRRTFATCWSVRQQKSTA